MRFETEGRCFVMQRLRIDLIAAARPNFMKVAPLFHELHAQPWCEVRLLHTGQHYDHNMSKAFFDDLGLPSPDLHLGVGSGSHAVQTANVMLAYETACLAERPDLIVVVGDVNATVACALVGTKLHIPVAHLEAGLRSRDRRMPEEINRLVTDAIADILWTPSPDADENLTAEGVAPEKFTRVGNIMIDSYELMRERIEASGERQRLGLKNHEYAVVTLHRPSNVDEREPLTALVNQLTDMASRLPLVFPVHPRTRKNLEAFGLWASLSKAPGVQLVEPLGYVDFMNLVCGARLTITDSGGVQEETTYLGIPCLTLRTTTERPITITEGTNQLVTVSTLGSAVDQILAGHEAHGRKPELWDGHTASRVAADIRRRLCVEPPLAAEAVVESGAAV
ncbi:UDP-N-acetylglucosamine 2-epimerase (non-hydrolyzing) [Rhodanobacter sp. AS-Z3]|uniref:non-hydrolyzing UDP-N-acetylglucosamine 2-epimerase n=1 Tax=Rhodanobacter sp. AS-Z3 TaxID=3031330 RepID=UPI00247875E0|nr:UDP-N-acetylglucosamine 2-epimerase (non-hydrolyzing) [Rhodanobacter sp. AS-Z3]WEN15362.1 UDP-N-acetylglucosamine 2-epimerase (non-hydrolyzing) [Rhodanobacter sp. AS-Z3]